MSENKVPTFEEHINELKINEAKNYSLKDIENKKIKVDIEDISFDEHDASKHYNLPSTDYAASGIIMSNVKFFDEWRTDFLKRYGKGGKITYADYVDSSTPFGFFIVVGSNKKYDKWRKKELDAMARHFARNGTASE
jgi:hypothetical protein